MTATTITTTTTVECSTTTNSISSADSQSSSQSMMSTGVGETIAPVLEVQDVSVTLAGDENEAECEVPSTTSKPRPFTNVIYSNIRHSAIGCESKTNSSTTTERSQVETSSLRELRFSTTRQQTEREAKAKQQLWNSLQLARRRILKIPESEDTSVKVFI